MLNYKMRKKIKNKCKKIFKKYNLKKYIVDYNKEDIRIDEAGAKEMLYDFLIRRVEEEIYNNLIDFSRKEIYFLTSFTPISQNYNKIINYFKYDILMYRFLNKSYKK